MPPPDGPNRVKRDLCNECTFDKDFRPSLKDFEITNFV